MNLRACSFTPSNQSNALSATRLTTDQSKSFERDRAYPKPISMAKHKIITMSIAHSLTHPLTHSLTHPQCLHLELELRVSLGLVSTSRFDPSMATPIHVTCKRNSISFLCIQALSTRIDRWQCVSSEHPPAASRSCRGGEGPRVRRWWWEWWRWWLCVERSDGVS